MSDSEQVDLYEASPLLKSKKRKQSKTDPYDVANSRLYRSHSIAEEPNSDQIDDRSILKSREEESGFKFFKALSGRRKYTLILITLASFLAGVAFSLLGPFYPSEATKKGMSIMVIGFVFGIFEVVIFLTAPFYGNYLVKIGPKFVFIAGIFIGGSCNVLFGTLQYCPGGTPFIVMSILIRSVEALGFSGFITSSFAIVSSEFKDNVGFTFGILETGSGLGFMLGPTIGGALYELGGFGLPFYFAGVAVLVNGLAVYKFLPPVEELPPKRKGSVFTLLRSPMIIFPLLSVMVGIIGITTYDSTFAKHLEPTGFSVGIVGVLFGVVALVYSIMSTIWGYISDTKNIQSPLIIGGHLIFGLGFSLIGPSFLFPFIPLKLSTLLIGLGCIGVSFGCLLVPTMKCMVLGAVELGFENTIDTYALVSGLFNSIHTLGGFIGPVGIGYLVQEYGYPFAYGFVGILSFVMMILSLVFFSYRKLRKSIANENVDDTEDPPTLPIPYIRRRSLSVSVAAG